MPSKLGVATLNGGGSARPHPLDEDLEVAPPESGGVVAGDVDHRAEHDLHEREVLRHDVRAQAPTRETAFIA